MLWCAGLLPYVWLRDACLPAVRARAADVQWGPVLDYDIRCLGVKEGTEHGGGVDAASADAKVRPMLSKCKHLVDRSDMQVD